MSRKTGSKKNISYHYDLGNEFYSTWLDDTMTYSSALYRSDNESLSQAQTNKYACLATWSQFVVLHKVFTLVHNG